MTWIKRNLYFLIFCVAAVALMGLAGWYLYSKWELSNAKTAKLNEQYETLNRLKSEKPHPGSRDVDNIEAAKKQREQLTNYIQQARAFFQRAPAIPDSPKVNSQEFTAALRKTIDRLQRDATAASVSLPPEPGGYSFSFTAHKDRLVFAPGSLEPLSVQLGEVKAICDILFQAKINSLDNLRREKASADDADGPPTDYLIQSSTTNDMSVLTPYELTFRCFSSELASVLAGFGGSPYAFIVKDITVELASASAGLVTDMNYRGGMGGMPGMPNSPRPYRQMQPQPQPRPMEPVREANFAPGASGKGGLPTVLDEKPLRVTLTLSVVKLLPQK